MDKTKTGARHRTAGGRGREDKDNKNNAKRTSSGTSSAGESARTRSSPSSARATAGSDAHVRTSEYIETLVHGLHRACVAARVGAC